MRDVGDSADSGHALVTTIECRSGTSLHWAVPIRQNSGASHWSAGSGKLQTVVVAASGVKGMTEKG